jgi:hypothetical protein
MLESCQLHSHRQRRVWGGSGSGSSGAEMPSKCQLSSKNRTNGLLHSYLEHPICCSTEERGLLAPWTSGIYAPLPGGAPLLPRHPVLLSASQRAVSAAAGTAATGHDSHGIDGTISAPLKLACRTRRAGRAAVVQSSIVKSVRILHVGCLAAMKSSACCHRDYSLQTPVTH